MGISTNSTLDAHLSNVVEDSNSVLQDLSKSCTDGEFVEIQSLLPAAPDPDIILGYVKRWREIQQHFNKELRVYAWCETTLVEKYILGCTQHMSHIHVTVLPTTLKEKKHYAF